MTDPALPGFIRQIKGSVERLQAVIGHDSAMLSPMNLALPRDLWAGRSSRAHSAQVAGARDDLTGASATLTDIAEALEDYADRVEHRLWQEAEARRRREDNGGIDPFGRPWHGS